MTVVSERLWRVTAGEDLSKEEHVDNEFLWHLKLLSEVCIGYPGCIVMLQCYEYLAFF